MRACEPADDMLGKFKPASPPGIMASFLRFPTSLPPLQSIITGPGQRETKLHHVWREACGRWLLAAVCPSSYAGTYFHLQSSNQQPSFAGGPMGVGGRPTPVEVLSPYIGRANGEEPDRRGPARNKKLAGGRDWVRRGQDKRAREKRNTYCMQVIVRSSLVPLHHTQTSLPPSEILLSPTRLTLARRNGAT